MPSLCSARRRQFVVCCLLSIGILSFADEARAGAGLLKALKEIAEAGAKNADLARHADRFSQISARVSNEVYFLTKSEGKLEIQLWSGGKAVDGMALAPEQISDVLQAVGDFKVFISKDNLLDYEAALLKVSEDTPLDLHVMLENGRTLPLRLRRLEGRPSLAIQASDNLSYSLKAWAKRSLLQRRVMPELGARTQVIVMAPETDTLQRQAFRTQLGKRVSFVGSERALRDELKNLDRQLAILVGHVEGTDFFLKSPAGDPQIRIPIADVHAAIDDSESIGLLLGCEVGCKTAFTGPDVDIDALDVTTGLRSGMSEPTPEDFLETLGHQIGALHVDEDFSGRLQAVSAESAKQEDRMIARTAGAAGVTVLVSESKEMSRRVLLPRHLPVFYTPSVFAGLYLLIFLFGWPILMVVYLFLGDSIGEVISSVWDIYHSISSSSISAWPDRFDRKLFVVFFGPHLIFFSLWLAMFAIPLLILMRIVSKVRSAPYPKHVSYKIRWFPFYIIFLFARLIKVAFMKVGVLNAGNPEPGPVV